VASAAYSQSIFDEAELFGVSPEIVAAVVLVESSGNSAAFRYEPGFYRRYIEGKSRHQLGGHWPSYEESGITEEQERTLRACSFGLMQVMGQVARELGFSGENLFDLYEPAIGIHFGVMKLAAEIERAKKRGVTEYLTAALLRYNGGGEPRYPEKVISKIRNGHAKNLLHDG
jgi:soluble lytic murein transglycosylase-like protein